MAKRTILIEAVDPVAKIQQLIDAANQAYQNALKSQNMDEEEPLMDKDGDTYGLSGEIKLTGNGYIIIPLRSYFGNLGAEKIKVLTKQGGKVKLFNGDFYDQGWKDAKKILNNIIRDAEIGSKHFQNYDPSWEDDTDTPYSERMANLKAHNKSIGRNANAGRDYITKESTERDNIKKTIKLTESDLHKVIVESVKRCLNEVSGWTLEKGDIRWANEVDPEDEQEYYERYAGNGDNYAGIKPYLVQLWQGSGYQLMSFGAWATSAEHALEVVVAYIEKEGWDFLFCDEEVEQEMEEMRAEGKDDEEIWQEIDNWAYHVDATMEGASQPHYVYTENLQIKIYNPDNVKD